MYLQEDDAGFPAGFLGALVPDGGLDFADMCLVPHGSGPMGTPVILYARRK